MTISRRHLLAACAAAGAGWSAAAVPAAARDVEQPTRLEREEADRLLVVLTKEVPLDPPDYRPDDLVPWQGGPYELRAEVADQLDLLVGEAGDAGLDLRVISGFRSYQTQAEVYEYWRDRNGRQYADATSARAGHSEHQTGLAVDLDSGSGECYLQPCFGDTDEGVWVAAQAYRFGFLLSYPEGAEQRTGYAYEPWHLRYVGPHAAGVMHRLGIELLPDYVDSRWLSADLGSALGRHP